MLFNSYDFVVFFALVFAVYWLLRNHVRAQNALILAGSFVFYGWWDERFLILILFSIITDYLFGWGSSGQRNRWQQVTKAFGFLGISSVIVLWIAGPDAAWIWKWIVLFVGTVGIAVLVFDKLGEALRRKAYLWASIFINLGMLGVFKYFNFFAEELQQIAASFGWEMSPVTLAVVLPVGISFYTFQTLSYTIDVYRGKLQPTSHFIEFAAFVSFFPQLVAGPIERAHHLLPQFFERRTLTLDRASSGIWLFIWGLCKKVVIADNLAPVADAVFGDPSAHGPVSLLAGLLAFAFQIYCDFSGYSDMARGCARLLGFELMLNFNIPYIARTPSEFWQRWHISLSSWLRDYLYIPMGGNRLGPLAVYRNLAITMLLGGLWHGANWTFVAWGAFHGLILIIYRVLNVDQWLLATNGMRFLDALRDVLAIAIMFTLTLFGWLLFRAESLTDVWIFIQGILDPVPGDVSLLVDILPYILGLLVVQSVQIRKGTLEVLSSMQGLAGLTLKWLIVYSLIFLSARGSQQFIYFDF
jgi:alginate O-acetyltransferase complex protein AlgI